MASQTAIGSTKNMQSLVFGTISVGNANGTLYSNIASIVEYRMASSGSVIGMAANMSGTLTTGTLQFYPTKNGSLMSNSFTNGTINIGTLGNFERQQSQQGGFSFNAGDTVGLMFQKTGTVAPTTRDMNALLIVLLENYDY